MDVKLITQDDYQGLVGMLHAIESKLDKITPEKLSGFTYTSEQVCTMLGISPKTLQTYRDRKRIGFSQLGSKVWYTAQDVGEFLSKNRFNPKGPEGSAVSGRGIKN